ncbi:hypothetical protein [Erysipelothrix anatis]|uniref:hypothetical protein n=1 Tax=Erysipelothrix anatis TaxID=2683713 RepID=UPI00140B622D|nr:hypothetical protein [Erysipelothrix anatis]
MNKLFKMFSVSVLSLLMFMVVVVPVNAEGLRNITDDDMELLVNTVFTPNSERLYEELDSDEIIMILEQYVIYKKNMKSDYTINIASLDESNLITKQRSKRAITETYVSLPSGKYSATTYWEVKTRGYGQQVTTLYLTASLANKYVAQNQSSGSETALKYLFDLAFSAIPKYGPVISVALAVVDVLDAHFYSQIANLSTNGNPVEIRLSRSSQGSSRTVLGWNGRTVRSRNGSSGNAHVTTTESTTIHWSSSK